MLNKLLNLAMTKAEGLPFELDDRDDGQQKEDLKIAQ